MDIEVYKLRALYKPMVSTGSVQMVPRLRLGFPQEQAEWPYIRNEWGHIHRIQIEETRLSNPTMVTRWL